MGSYAEFDRKSDKPKKASKAAMVGLAILLIVGVAGFLVLRWWWERHQILHGDADVEKRIRLDDGTVVSVESVTIRERVRDVNDIEETRETIHWRLRSFVEATNALKGRVITEEHPDCKAAKGARIWCLWDGSVRLLDAKLVEVGKVEAGRRGEGFDVDTSGGLVLMGDDGIPERYDPVTMAMTRPESGVQVDRRAASGLTPIVQIGGAIYELSVKSGQMRATLVRSGGKKLKKLTSKDSWLADGFLGDETGKSGDALLLPDGFFLVHRERIAMDSPHSVSRLNLEGKVLWTAKVPEPVLSGVLEGDGVIVAGRDYSVKLSLADGKQLWQTRH